MNNILQIIIIILFYGSAIPLTILFDKRETKKINKLIDKKIEQLKEQLNNENKN